MIYISSAVKPMNYDQLTALLQQCRDNNQEHGVSGMLLYQNGTFMQMLEGEKQVVLDLYHDIKKDDRHTGFHTVLEGDIEERNFRDWSMGFFNMDKAGEFPKYKDYIKQNLVLSSFEAGSKDAYDFMVTFNKINE
ncbi:MAG: BLUF domain-containing protein [Gammaproteobacteria bacterium]|nr:BLUF domain-containing protein [Gammaproteobacteria bacterium]